MAGFYDSDPYHGHHRRTSHHLSPDFGASLHRSRSQGHGPRPEINIYNEQIAPTVFPPSPGLRGRSPVSLGDELLAEELAALRIARSRSRSRTDASMMPWDHRRSLSPNDLLQLQSTMEQKYELKRLQDKLDEERRKEREAAVIADYERRQREEKDNAKAAEIALIQKIEREKIEKKEREEREYNEFLRKQKEKKEKEEREKKEREEELEAAMRERLREKGFTDAQVKAMIRREKSEAPIAGSATALVPFPGRGPVYPKAHIDHLDTATLRYFGIPYEYDSVSFLLPPTNTIVWIH